jgi:hypothetical protein
MRRGRKSSWEGEQMDCSTGLMNRNRKIVMVKLIIQKKKKKKNRYSNK